MWHVSLITTSYKYFESCSLRTDIDVVSITHKLCLMARGMQEADMGTREALEADCEVMSSLQTLVLVCCTVIKISNKEPS